MIIYKNADIITMAGNEIIHNGVIAVNGNKIVKVCSNDDFNMAELDGENHVIVDLSGKTVMPGLINSHMHLTMWRSFGSITLSKDTATQAFMAARNALNCIRKGVTSVRDMGHKDDVHMQLKKASEEGVILAPRIKAAIEIIEMSYGHAYHFCTQVDNSDQLVKAIRQQINFGTDFIKIIASHDDLWHIESEQNTVPWFSQEDLNLAVKTAHDVGVKLSAHANGSECIRRVVNAGFDCIEHGIFMTEDTAKLMKEKQITLVPTLSGYKENSQSYWNRGENWTKRYGKFWDGHRKSIEYAVKCGVNIAAGTDTLGTMPEEITLLHNAGMTKFEALAAATINGAVLLDLDDKVGSLEAGKLADFIVLSRNPLEDLSALEDITYVVFNGSFYDIKALDNIVPRCSIYIQGW